MRASLLPFCLVALGLVAIVRGQATNDPTFALRVNGNVADGPSILTVQQPGSITFTFSGNPGRPFVFFAAPTLSIGEIFFPPVQVDVGPGSLSNILMNGVSGTALLDGFANTGNTGTTSLSLQVNGQFSNGLLAAFQAIVVDFTAPFGVADSAATEIMLVPPLNYGRVDVFRGPTLQGLSAHSQSFSGPTVAHSFPSSSFSIDPIYLVRRSQFLASSDQGGDVDRLRAPTAARPLRRADNPAFPHLRTINGDVYHFEDGQSGQLEWGFLTVVGPGTPPFEILGTRRTNGAASISPWRSGVEIDEQSNVMAAVCSQLGALGDSLHLIRLDGTVFPATGTPIAEITPLGHTGTISESSLVFSNGAVYFVGGFATGTLYRAPADGSQRGTAVVLPPLGTGQVPTLVHVESVRSEAQGDLFIQAGLTPTNEDVYRLSSITGFGETALNVTAFPVPVEIEEFGDAYDGDDGQFAVSPSGQRIAFVVRSSFQDELVLKAADGSGSAVHVTSPAYFDAAIDEVLELNHRDDGHVTFFAGTSATQTDLYQFTLSTAALLNVTGTNGLAGQPLPVAAAPPAAIDPDGMILLADRMIFARDGNAAFGPSAGAGVFNLVGVDYATMTPYNVLGDEFPGPGTTSGVEGLQTGLALTFAPTGTLAFFKSELLGGGGDEQLFVFDLATSSPATQLTAHAAGGVTIEDIAPHPTGTSALATRRLPGGSMDEEVLLAPIGGIFAIVLTDDGLPGSDVADGTLRWIDPAAPSSGFVWVQGADMAQNPTDAVLRGYDLMTGLQSLLSPIAGAQWIYAIGYP